MMTETKAKHTAEKWHCNPNYGKENVYYLWDEDDNYHEDVSPEAMDVRARLIAAAPEMLEALENSHGWLRILGNSSVLNPPTLTAEDIRKIQQVAEIAEAAIRKAKGEQ